MGYRFLFNLTPFHKSCISRISSCSPSYNSKIFKNLEAFRAAANSGLYDHSIPYAENPSFKIHKRWHVGHTHHHQDGRDVSSGKQGEKVFRLGLAADIGLAAGKSLTGYLSGSTAIIADAAHSISDVVLSGVALLSFKAARVPKDKEHPYGHGKFETLGALGISGVLLATAGGIAWHAFVVLMEIFSAAPEIANQSLVHDHHDNHHSGHHHGIDMDHPILALNMTLISIAVKEGLYWITKMAGEKTGSGLMKANAWHHRSDAVSSVVALVGVGGSILGIGFLDPLAGLLVSGMILKAGLESGYQSVMELVDAAVPSQHLEIFKHAIQAVEGVKGYKHLRGRRAGSSLYLDVDIEVDPFSSVSAAHVIGENVRRQIQQSHPEVSEVLIHIEPSTSHISPHVINNQRNFKNLEHQIENEQTDVEDTVSSLLSTNFSERDKTNLLSTNCMRAYLNGFQKMTVERMTRHMLEGQIFLEIVVSMGPNMLISEAVEVADEAERKILKAMPNIMLVSIQLQLGQPIPESQR